jgi:hypothetical protein
VGTVSDIFAGKEKSLDTVVTNEIYIYINTVVDVCSLLARGFKGRGLQSSTVIEFAS